MASILMDVDAIIDLCRDHGEQGTLMHEVMVRMCPTIKNVRDRIAQYKLDFFEI